MTLINLAENEVEVTINTNSLPLKMLNVFEMSGYHHCKMLYATFVHTS